MESESLGLGIVSAVSAVALELLRRGVKQLADAKTAAAVTFKQITDGHRADNARAIDAVVAQARVEAELLAEIRSLREVIEEAVAARRRDDAVLLDQFRDSEVKLDAILSQMARYVEFREHPVRRRDG